jgi:hypothetical protein
MNKLFNDNLNNKLVASAGIEGNKSTISIRDSTGIEGNKSTISIRDSTGIEGNKSTISIRDSAKIEGNIPNDFPLKNIMLPNIWVLYLYDKQLFKKMANRPNFQAKPHLKLCEITTVNDLMYILQLMNVKNISSQTNNDHINLDVNDYIIMRKGIEPIWEDPKNSNGGTFTIKIPHQKGYDVWSTFIMYILGETFCTDMEQINGITVSYITDNYHGNHSNNYTYIKIWDAKHGRTRDQFIGILPIDILNKIKDESLMYSQNNRKEDFNKKNLLSKLGNRNSQDNGGFRI